MSAKRKALVLGDYKNFTYHPFTNMDQAVTEVLSEDFEAICTEDYSQLQPENITKYDLVITYTESWQREFSDEETAGLIGFVNNGGGLLAIHNGVSIQARQELMHMLGAKFTGHPPYCELEIKIKAPEHPIVKGIEAFTIQDEPYQFDFMPHTTTEILLEYDLEGVTYPAGWTHKFGKGKVVCLMPGHDEGPFKIPAYRQMILQAAQYLV